MNTNIISAIKHILVAHLFVRVPAEQIGVDDGLQSVIGLDSVDFAELRVQCERRFDLTITDDEFSPDNFRSVRCLSVLIERLQGGRDATAA